MMVDALNIRCLFPAHLLFAVLSLMAYIGQCQAGQLMDIRIGEHDNFTRVVFELDVLVESDLKISTTANQIEIRFPDTRPNLIQKIPLKRAKHIKNIQIWATKDKLAAVLELSAKHTKVDSFPLSAPPRIALDVYWQDEPEPSNSRQAVVSNSKTADQSEISESKIQSALLPASEKEPVEEPITDKTSVEPNDIKEALTIIVPTPAQEVPSSFSAAGSTHRGKNRTVSPPLTIEEVTTPPANRNTKPHANRLQYYLVIVLVVITITILILLALMLLTRYRWVNGDPPLHTNEFLKKQEQRLTLLDERINEQLKRYEDA